MILPQVFAGNRVQVQKLYHFQRFVLVGFCRPVPFHAVCCKVHLDRVAEESVDDEQPIVDPFRLCWDRSEHGKDGEELVPAHCCHPIGDDCKLRGRRRLLGYIDQVITIWRTSAWVGTQRLHS